MIKRSLVTGVLGQSGSFMAELLHSKGYMVYGVVHKNTELGRIEWLMKRIPSLIIFRADITRYSDMYDIIIKVMPDEVYNFAGVSNIFDPFKNVGTIMEVNGRAPGNIMSLLFKNCPSAKFFQASSRLVFGKNYGHLNEDSIRSPEIPYASAKLHADEDVHKWRNEGLFACSGIFFNHESERRQHDFFSRKVSWGIAKVLKNGIEKIRLGGVDSSRDFGYARDYIYAAWLMLQNETPKDYVIGTGISTPISEYVEMALNMYGLGIEWVSLDASLKREKEPEQIANITRINTDLNWQPTVYVQEIIKIMVEHDIKILNLSV